VTDEQTSQVSSGALQRGKRVIFWILGTVVAGAIPLCAIPGVILFVRHKVPTWTEMCSRGDFFIVAAVIVIAASVELLSALARQGVGDRSRRLMVYTLAGGLFLLVGMIGIYLLVLGGAEQGQQFSGENAQDLAQNIINWMSPLALAIAAVYGILSAYLSGGE
jgi:hypothetical protein